MKFESKFPTAVVILSYNSLKWHRLFLPAIVAAGEGVYDIFIIDHASTEPIQDYIHQAFPTVNYIRLNENHGFAWGYAEGLKMINAKYYVFLSSDFEVTPNWLQPLQEKLDNNLSLAACQPKIRYYKEKEKFEYAGAAGGFMDKWGYLFCRGRIFDTLEVDAGQYDDDVEVFWASGGCFMVRADIYHQLGGLDSDFGSHMEEVDLCWRMKNAGYKIAYVHNSIVYHVGGSIISYGSPAKTFYNFRNSYFIFMKNEIGSKLVWLLPWRLCLDGISGVQFILKGQFRNFLAILKAHFSFYSHFLQLLKKRKELKVHWNNRNTIGMESNSIIVDYFINKKQRFTDLKLKITKI